MDRGKGVQRERRRKGNTRGKADRFRYCPSLLPSLSSSRVAYGHGAAQRYIKRHRERGRMRAEGRGKRTERATWTSIIEIEC